MIEASEKNIRKRFETIQAIYKNSFVEGLDQNYKSQIWLNDELLHCAIVAYFDDIEKFKAYSGSTYANRYKQAAYTIKWISRFKPIQIKESAVQDTVLLTINAAFALFVGFIFLNPGVPDCISKDFYDELIYTLTYREMSGKELSMILYLMECVSSGNKKM